MATEYRIQLNLALPPQRLQQASPDENCFTVPDGHGNFILLLHILGYVGAIEIPDATYLALYKLYNSPKQYTEKDQEKFCLGTFEAFFSLADKYSKEDLKAFDELIAAIEVNPEIFARLIGDIVCDRNRFDLFTLRLLRHIKKEAIKQGKPCPFSINLSNHDLDFIRWCEEGCPSLSEIMADPKMCEHYSLLFAQDASTRRSYGQSLLNLIFAIDIGTASRQEVLDIYHEVYKPALRLYDCDLTTIPWLPQDPKVRAGIFSHGVIGPITVAQAAQELNTPVYGKEPEQLAATIDGINEKLIRLPTIVKNGIYIKPEDLGLSPYCAHHEEPRLFCYSSCWSRELPPDIQLPQTLKTFYVNGHNGGVFSHQMPSLSDATIAQIEGLGLLEKPLGELIAACRMPPMRGQERRQKLNQAAVAYMAKPLCMNRSDIDGHLGKYPPGVTLHNFEKGHIAIIGTKRRIPRYEASCHRDIGNKKNSKASESTASIRCRSKDDMPEEQRQSHSVQQVISFLAQGPVYLMNEEADEDAHGSPPRLHPRALQERAHITDSNRSACGDADRASAAQKAIKKRK